MWAFLPPTITLTWNWPYMWDLVAVEATHPIGRSTFSILVYHSIYHLKVTCGTRYGFWHFRGPYIITKPPCNSKWQFVLATVVTLMTLCVTKFSRMRNFITFSARSIIDLRWEQICHKIFITSGYISCSVGVYLVDAGPSHLPKMSGQRQPTSLHSNTVGV